MKNYHSYFNDFTEDDFAENEYFRQWVLYEEAESHEFWNEYLQINPHRLPLILRAKKKVTAAATADTSRALTAAEKSILKNDIFRQISQPVKPLSFLRQKVLPLLKIAAVISGTIFVTMYFFYKKPAAPVLIVKRTGIQEVKKIWLPDSTVIILNANSSITYNSEINQFSNRSITLQGNAYFKVKKKVDGRPFTVHTNLLSIAVLGTSFNVNARTKATAVVLATGKVKVSLDGRNSALYMNPGEKVEFDTLSNQLKKTDINAGLYSAWTDGKWNFSSTTLLDVTNLINEYYGVETVYKNEKAKQLLISAVIPVTDLNAFTNILSKTLDISITNYHNQLYIQP